MKAMLKAKRFTMAVACLAFAAMFAGCPMDNQDDGTGQTGGIPAALVGSWGAGNVEFIRINADGTGVLQGTPVEWSVDGNRLIMTIDLGPGHGGAVFSSARWEIVGGRLRLTEGQGHMGHILTLSPYLDRLGGGNGGDDDPDNGNGEGPGDDLGRIPTALVGEWGVAGTVVLTINADGTGAHHALQGNTVEWSVDGNRLIMTIDMGAGQGGFMTSSARWEIVGGRLRLTDGQGHMGPILTIYPYLDRIGGDPGDGNGNGEDPGIIPAALVGTWGIGADEMLRINADGSGHVDGTPVSWSASAGRLTAVWSPGGSAFTGSVAWRIRDGRLHFSNPQGTQGAVLMALMSVTIHIGSPGFERLDGIPAILVGTWGIGTDEMFLINSDGSGHITETPVSWSASAGRLTAVWSPGGSDFTGSVAWEIRNDRLHFSSPQGTQGTVLMTLMSATVIMGSPGFERLGPGDGGEVTPIGITVDPSFVSISTNESVQFTATVVPVWASQAVTWAVEPSDTTGTIDSNGLFTSHWEGTFHVRVTALDDTSVYAIAEVHVWFDDWEWCCGCPCGGGMGCGILCGNCHNCDDPDPGYSCCGCGCDGSGCCWGHCGDCYRCWGSGIFTITFADFYSMTPITVSQPLRIIGSPEETSMDITVDNPGQYQTGSIRWMLGGSLITAGVSGAYGETLTLDSRIHDNRIGTHTVTVVVTDMDGVAWSQAVIFTVVRD